MPRKRRQHVALKEHAVFISEESFGALRHSSVARRSSGCAVKSLQLSSRNSGADDAATSERFCGGENKFRLSLKQPAELCPARGQLPAAERPVRRDSFSSWKSPRQSPDVRVSASSVCTCRVRESAEGTRPAGSRHLHQVRIAGSLEIAEALRLRSRWDRFSRSAPIGSYRENPT